MPRALKAMFACLTSTGGTSWTVNAARPEATLFTKFFGQDVQIITHFASINANPNQNATLPVPKGGNATWQSSFDTSKVWAKAVGTWSPPVPTPRVARIQARFLAFCCSPSGISRGQREVNSCQCHLRPTVKHQRWSCPHYRLHCGSDSACSVLGRLFLLPRGPVSTLVREFGVVHAESARGWHFSRVRSLV